MSAEGCVDVRSFLGQEKEVEVAYNRRDLIGENTTALSVKLTSS